MSLPKVELNTHHGKGNLVKLDHAVLCKANGLYLSADFNALIDLGESVHVNVGLDNRHNYTGKVYLSKATTNTKLITKAYKVYQLSNKVIRIPALGTLVKKLQLVGKTIDVNHTLLIDNQLCINLFQYN